MGSCKTNIKDNQIILDDNVVITTCNNIPVTPRLLKSKMNKLDSVLHITKTTSYKKSVARTTYSVRTKANGGNYRQVNSSTVACKFKKRTPVFTFDINFLFNSYFKVLGYLNDSLCRQENSLFMKDKFTAEEKIQILKKLVPELRDLTDDNIVDLVNDLRERKRVDNSDKQNGTNEINGMTTKILIKYYNNKDKNRAFITDICTIMWLLSNGKEYLFTRNCEQSGTIEIPYVLTHLFLKIINE